jgi:hypothetical protein
MLASYFLLTQGRVWKSFQENKFLKIQRVYVNRSDANLDLGPDLFLWKMLRICDTGIKYIYNVSIEL